MVFSKDQLEPGEEVIATLQDHWIKLIPQFFILATSWILFFLLIFFAISIFTGVPYLPTIFFSVAVIILLIGHHFFFLSIISYLVSSLIITNKRLIEIHFFPLVEDDVDYIEIDQIHEIEKSKHGFIPNLLNYGTVSFNITGKSFKFTYLSYPSKFINLIETIKSGKPLISVDLRKTGANCPPQYQFLLKKKK